MRFTPIVAWAILAYGSVADDAQKVLSDESSSSAAESATSSVDASLPTFTVSLTPNNPDLTNKGSSAGTELALGAPRTLLWSSCRSTCGQFMSVDQQLIRACDFLAHNPQGPLP